MRTVRITEKNKIIEKYIALDALLAEIDKRIKVLQKHPMENHKTICHLDSVKQSVNSIEAKEVDLERLVDDYFKGWYFDRELDILAKPNHYSATVGDVKDIAKHFFELGLNVSNPLTWEDINSILYIERLVLREFGGQEHSNEELCREVLKRFKAQKEEKI